MRIIPAWLLKKDERPEPSPASERHAPAPAPEPSRGADAQSPFAAAFLDDRWYRSAHPDADRAIRRGDFASCLEHYRHVARTHAYSPSPLFDEAWYRRRYPEACRAVQSGEVQSGLDHYLTVGAALEYVPCPYFDSKWYAAVNPDVTESSWLVASGSLFAHFVLRGQAEGRLPNALFDPSWYSRTYPHCRKAITEGQCGSAFEHYCSQGGREGLAASPYFLEGEYVRSHPDVAALIRGGLYPNGFSHYVLEGARSGLVGNPFFDDAAYLSLNVGVAEEPVFRTYPSPLSHYAHSGARQGRAPHDLFDSIWYLSAYPEARRAVEVGDFDSPFAHFCAIGRGLGRRPGPRFDEVYYLELHPDVAEAVTKGGMHSGFSHYLRHGRKEGRGAHPFIPSLLLESLGADAVPANWKPALGGPLRVPANLAELSNRSFLTCEDEIEYFRTLVEEFPEEAPFRELLAYALLRSFDVAGAARAASDLESEGIERACLVSAIGRLAGNFPPNPDFARHVERTLSDRLPFFEIDEPLPRRAFATRSVDFFLRGWLFHPCVKTWELSILVGSLRFPVTFGYIRPDVHRRFEAVDTMGASHCSGFQGSVIAEVDALGPPGTTVMLELCAKSGETIDGVERSFEFELGGLSITRKPAAASRSASAPGASRPVAICMAAFDPDPNLLVRQIESIRAQSYRSWTLTISDESGDPGRSDELGRIVDGDSRMKILRSTPRRGFYFNFETALAAAPRDAEFIALADQDDYWYPEKIETLLAGVSSPGVSLAFADMRLVTPDGEVLADTFWTGRENHWSDPVDLLLANTVTGAGSMFRGELLEHALPFPVVPHLYHDQWIAICAAATGRIHFIDAPLHDYVQHGNNVVGAHRSSEAEEPEWLRALYDRVRNPKNPRTDFRARLVAYCAREWGEEPARLSHVLAVLDSRTTPRGAPRGPAIAEVLEKRLRGLGPGAARRTLGAEWRISVAQHALEQVQAHPESMLRIARDEGAEVERARVVRRDCAAARDLGAVPRDAAEDLALKVLPLEVVIDTSFPERVNFLIPEIAYGTFSGSYIGKFQLALKLARISRQVRLICVDGTGANVAEWLKIERSFPGLSGFFDEVEVVRAFGRSEKIGFNPRDSVIATTWWTAHIAGKLVEKLERSRFLYLIQEYEPFTFPMGSWHAMAHESYSLPHDALFSTSLLARYFEKREIGVFGPKGGRSASFSNAVLAFPSESPRVSGGPRRLAYYCRPEGHAARNMFEVGTAALRIAIEQGVFDGEKWEFCGLGTDSKDVRLGPHHELRQVKKLSMSKYQEELTRFDVGLSLMYTPHPSLVPIEMAAAGLLVVSNTCENKTESELLSISDRFVPCVPTIEGVVAGLRAAVKRLRASKERKLNSVNWPQSWDEALNDGVMSYVDECLRPELVGADSPRGSSYVTAAASRTR